MVVNLQSEQGFQIEIANGLISMTIGRDMFLNPCTLTAYALHLYKVLQKYLKGFYSY